MKVYARIWWYMNKVDCFWRIFTRLGNYSVKLLRNICGFLSCIFKIFWNIFKITLQYFVSYMQETVFDWTRLRKFTILYYPLDKYRLIPGTPLIRIIYHQKGPLLFNRHKIAQGEINDPLHVSVALSPTPFRARMSTLRSVH